MAVPPALVMTNQSSPMPIHRSSLHLLVHPVAALLDSSRSRRLSRPPAGTAPTQEPLHRRDESACGAVDRASSQPGCHPEPRSTILAVEHVVRCRDAVRDGVVGGEEADDAERSQQTHLVNVSNGPLTAAITSPAIENAALLYDTPVPGANSRVRRRGGRGCRGCDRRRVVAVEAGLVAQQVLDRDRFGVEPGPPRGQQVLADGIVEASLPSSASSRIPVDMNVFVIDATGTASCR